MQPVLLIELSSWKEALNKPGSCYLHHLDNHPHHHPDQHSHPDHPHQYNRHDFQTRERQIENLRSIQRLGDNLASLRLVMNIVARIIQMTVLALDGADDDHGDYVTISSTSPEPM